MNILLVESSVLGENLHHTHTHTHTRSFFFWLHHTAYKILVPQPGIKPVSMQWMHGVITARLPGKSHIIHSLSCIKWNLAEEEASTRLKHHEPSVAPVICDVFPMKGCKVNHIWRGSTVFWLNMIGALVKTPTAFPTSCNVSDRHLLHRGWEG